MIIVADSGATKTTWYYSSPETSGTATTCGLHPDIIDGFTPSDYDKILPLMNKSGKIYFYGSGCATSKRQEVVYQWLKTRFPLYDIVVQSDLIASAISLYGQQSGIVGILGTGASMAIWDNQTMTLPIPSLGWTIGDEGSGFDIAKRFFKAWYSGKFPKQVNTLLDKNRQMPNAIELLNNIHKHGHPNKKIASFCTEISQLTHFAPIRSLIEQAFHDYFDYYNNILVNKANRPIGFTGGVAHGFKTILMATAKSRGLDIFSVIDNPIKKLAAFHIADYSGLSNSF